MNPHTGVDGIIIEGGGSRTGRKFPTREGPVEDRIGEPNAAVEIGR